MVTKTQNGEMLIILYFRIADPACQALKPILLMV